MILRLINKILKMFQNYKTTIMGSIVIGCGLYFAFKGNSELSLDKKRI